MDKIIMIGGNDPEMAKAVLQSLSKNAKEATIYELDSEEMSMITSNRMQRAASKELKEFMEDEENKKQAKVIATEFHKRFAEAFDKDLFLKKSFVKNQTNFSWKKFNEVLASLDMFGFVEWGDEKKEIFRIILSDEDILENKKKETQSILDLAIGKVEELQSALTNKKDKDKLETLKKKMKLTI